MKMFFQMFLLVVSMTALVVQAQSLPTVKTFLGVEYVTGGIGIEEEQALAEMAKEYTLKVVTALTCGDYLNKINLLIEDKDGNIVLETVTDGPILYANLQPGKYTVSASAYGEEYKKPLTTKAGRQKQLVFYWPVEVKACEKEDKKE